MYFGGVKMMAKRMTESEKETIRRMRENGAGYGEIAKLLGLNKKVVKSYCQRNGLGGFRSNANKHSEILRNFIERFNQKYSDEFEYVSGYTNCDSSILVRCKRCGSTFEKNAQVVRKKKRMRCDICTQQKKETKEREREEQRKRLEEQRQLSMIAKQKAEEERERKRLKKCNECGNEFRADHLGRKYCSDECLKKHQRRIRKYKHKLKMKRLDEEGLFDESITLSKLIAKYNNTCYLCGGQCDSSDYTITKEGYFIVGSMYPSIDHVVPISKGGTHTWDNVKLAHHGCNSLKNDDVSLTETKQLILPLYSY